SPVHWWGPRSRFRSQPAGQPTADAVGHGFVRGRALAVDRRALPLPRRLCSGTGDDGRRETRPARPRTASPRPSMQRAPPPRRPRSTLASAGATCAAPRVWMGPHSGSRGTAGSGSPAGIFYVPFGITGGMQILATPNNTRVVGIFDGQLYASAASGTFVN